MNLPYILLAILLLGILVIIHEAGHFFAARLTGIPVVEFSVGFGPKLLQFKTRKHGTLVSLRLLPLGGFCAFYSPDEEQGILPGDPRCFSCTPVWKRIVTILMGPLMNFILAFGVMIVFYMTIGTSVYEPFISSVVPGSPAAQVQIQAGDTIRAIDGVDLIDAATTDIVAALAGWTEDHAPFVIDLSHADGSSDTVSVSPVPDEADQVYRIGITLSYRNKTIRLEDGSVVNVSLPVDFLTAVSYSWESCIYAGSMVLNALRSIVTTGEGLNETSGIIGTVAIVSQEVQSGGFSSFLNLLVVISINLGIMNLLPIPGLDGSRFLFLVLEGIRRKPIPEEKENLIHAAGVLLLLLLGIALMFKDVWTLIH